MLDIDYVVSEISDSGKDVVYDIENTSGYSYDQKKIVGTVTDTTVNETLAWMRRNFRIRAPDLAKQNISEIKSRYYKKQYNFNTIFDINLKPEDYEINQDGNREKECPLKDESAVELLSLIHI